METCPCGSGTEYGACCAPYIQGDQQPQTAEALMRARYSAHVKSQVDYIYDTTHPDHKKNCDPKSVAAWCRKAQWQALEVLAVTDGGPEDQTGTVEFVARYREKERPYRHHEIAEFLRHEGRWYFKDGQPPAPVSVIHSETLAFPSGIPGDAALP